MISTGAIIYHYYICSKESYKGENKMTVQEYLIDHGYENNAVEIITYNGDGYNRLCINFNYITHRHSLYDIPKDLREREVLSVNFLDDGYLLIEV